MNSNYLKMRTAVALIIIAIALGGVSVASFIYGGVGGITCGVLAFFLLALAVSEIRSTEP